MASSWIRGSKFKKYWVFELTAFLDLLIVGLGFCYSELFSAIIAAATVSYAILTTQLVAETRKTREIQTAPKIYVGIRPTLTRVSRELDIASVAKAPFAYNINLFIENVGRGPAYDIRLSVPEEFRSDFYKSSLSKLSIFNKSIGYLAPNQEISFFLTLLPLERYLSSPEIFEGMISPEELDAYRKLSSVLTTEPVKIQVDYYRSPSSSDLREKTTETFPIDFSYLAELQPPTDMNYQFEMLITLKGIKEEIAAINKPDCKET